MGARYDRTQYSTHEFITRSTIRKMMRSTIEVISAPVLRTEFFSFEILLNQPEIRLYLPFSD